MRENNRLIQKYEKSFLKQEVDYPTSSQQETSNAMVFLKSTNLKSSPK